MFMPCVYLQNKIKKLFNHLKTFKHNLKLNQALKFLTFSIILKDNCINNNQQRLNLKKEVNKANINTTS